MDFYDLLDQVIELLRNRKRVSYRALKLQFRVEDEYIEAIKEELTEVQQIAVDQDGKMLVWTGNGSTAAGTLPAVPSPASHPAAVFQQAHEPLYYTPQHLADKILTSRTALEGERKQVTAFFCDLAKSTAAAERIGPENMHTLLNRFFELALEEVHRYEGTINQFLGDGFMALFGAPIAHEDHARRGEQALSQFVGRDQELATMEEMLALEAEAQTRAIGETISDPRIQTYGTFTTGWITAMIGDWNTAIDVCQRSLQGAPDPASTAYASAFLGYAYLEQGNAAQALPLLDQAVQRFAQFRFPQFEGWFTALLAEAHRCSGQLEAARELAQRALEIVRSVPYWFGVGWAQRSLGRIAQAAGAPANAEALLQEAVETFAAMPAPFELGRTRLDLAVLAHSQDRQETAGTHLSEAHTLFRKLKVPQYVERTEQLAYEYGIPHLGAGN